MSSKHKDTSEDLADQLAEAFADGWRRGTSEQRMEYIRQAGRFPPDDSELLRLRKENAELRVKLAAYGGGR